MTQFARLIRDVPDFPRKGILFKDITPMLRDQTAFSSSIRALEELHAQDRVDAIAAVESRGFIFGGALALRLGAGFIPIRKPGKLPHDTLSESYALEYGSDTIEIHADAVRRGDRVVLLDDLLATGGTARAGVNLLRKLGAEVVAATFVVELDFLKGRRRLEDVPVNALIHYP
ncbi:MAG TPA: adenine phosphoribosyltransferase [Candidatus Polarisedimenticolia bacterium]|nr:adenine phosphoribosyltransferase [Candidatus Polarisedimenticolia bacterium]